MGALWPRPLQDIDRLRGTRALVPAQRGAGDHRGGGGPCELGSAEGRRRHHREPANAGRRVSSTPRFARAVPIIFVANVQASAEFFRDTLGFSIDFLHGHPPFYGAVSRDGACVHLKFVHEPVFAIGTQDREGFIMAFIEVENVKALYASYVAAGVTFEQKLRKQAWGGRDFIVRDLDGNAHLLRAAPPRQATSGRPGLDHNEGAREESIHGTGWRRNSRLTFDAISAMNLFRPVHRVGCIEQGNSSCATGLG